MISTEAVLWTVGGIVWLVLSVAFLMDNIHDLPAAHRAGPTDLFHVYGRIGFSSFFILVGTDIVALGIVSMSVDPRSPFFGKYLIDSLIAIPWLGAVCAGLLLWSKVRTRMRIDSEMQGLVMKGGDLVNKNSPGARFIRTFIQLMTGVAAGAALIDWTTNYKQGAVFVALGTISAIIGSALAFFMAMAEWKASSPIGKGLATFAQLMAGGLATLAINDWTNAAFISFGQALVRLVVASVVAAIAAFLQNLAEDSPIPVRPTT